MKIKAILKKLLAPPLTFMLGIIPESLLFAITRRCPRFLPYLPEGKKLILRRFLGDITVNVDTVYPIEREMLTGLYEKGTLWVFDKYIKKGDVCFDIGANIGPLSFAMAKITGENGKVYAFEPGTEIFGRLCNNLKLNPKYDQRILPYKIAFSSESKIMYWNEDSVNRGNGGFLIQPPNQEEPVELVTLDSFVENNNIGRIDFIKIDVEGMEYDVIKGGIASIDKHKPVLYYETGFFEKGFWSEVARKEKVILHIEQLLRSLGYRIYKIEDNKVTETSYPDLSYNTLALYRGE